MPERIACPRCGRELPDDAPRGLCPACLLGAAMVGPNQTLNRETAYSEDNRTEPGRTVPELAETDDGERYDGETLEMDSQQRAEAEHGLALATIRYVGDYALKRLLGRGGAGEVWLAHQTTLDDRPVAVKTLRSTYLDAKDRTRFRIEAEAIAALDYPNLVEIYEVGEHEGQPFYSMKFYSGGSLNDRLEEFRNDPRRAAMVVAKVARAVHHVHQRAILHRDLKPANVMLDERGEPHVTDFGLAKRLDDDSSLSISGAVLGTPAFMSPEQTTGRKGTVTTSSDVYGLGAVLYSLITGHAPFEGGSLADILQAVRELAPDPPSRQNARLPRDVEVICLKCLEKEPRRRYASAEALAEDLERFHAGKPIEARPVGAATRAWMWCKRNPGLAALGLGLLLALSTGTVVSSYFADRARKGERDALNSAGIANRKAKESLDLAGQLGVEKDRIESLLYGAEMRLTQRELQTGNRASLVGRLDAYRPAREGAVNRRGLEWFFLDRFASAFSELRTLGGTIDFTPFTLASTFSPDGRTLAVMTFELAPPKTDSIWDDRPHGRERSDRVVSSPSGMVSIWDVGTGRVIKNWSAAHWEERAAENPFEMANVFHFVSLAYHPDGTCLASAATNSKVIMLWDVATGSERTTLPGHENPVSQLVFSPDGSVLVSGDLSGAVKLWDVPENDRLERTIHAHKGPVSRIAFRRDGRRFATGSRDDPSVRVWDPATGREVASLSQSEGGTLDLAFSPDGSLLFTLSTRGIGRLWDADSARLVGAARLPTFGRVIFPREGPRVVGVAVVENAPDPRAWPPPLFKSQDDSATTQGPKGPRDVAPFGSTPYGSLSTSLQVWDARTSKLLVSFPGRFRLAVLANHALAVHPDGRLLFTPGNTYEPHRLWDITAEPEPLVLDVGGQGLDALAVSRDDTLVAAACRDDVVRVSDIDTGWQVAALTKPKRSPEERTLAVAFLDRGRLVSASGAGTLHVWDLQAARHEEVFETDGAWHTAFFSRNGRRLASIAADGTVGLWETTTGTRLWSRHLSGEATGMLAFDADEGLVVAEVGGGRVSLHDAATYPESEPAPGSGRKSVVTLSDDGRSLAISGGGMVSAWDRQTGKPRWAIVPPETSRNAPHPLGIPLDMCIFDSGVSLIPSRFATQPATLFSVFNPDGTRIATMGTDEITLRNASTGVDMLVISGHVDLISFSASGRVMAGASRGARPGTWEIEPPRVWDSRDATPERKALREARSFVRWLSAQGLSRDEIQARVKADASLPVAVRAAALNLARQRPEPSSKRDPHEPSKKN